MRVIEDGEVRTVIEAVFHYGDSFICQHYKLPKHGTEIEIQVRVHWSEKSKMLKLVLPTPFTDAACRGQVAYGTADLPVNGTEAVAQKWTAVVSAQADAALTCINHGCYGLDCRDGALRLSLLRSPAYTCHPIPDRPLLCQDRYSPRIDQGERLFVFHLNAGPAAERLAQVDREALAYNEAPLPLSFLPVRKRTNPRAAGRAGRRCQRPAHRRQTGGRRSRLHSTPVRAHRPAPKRHLAPPRPRPQSSRATRRLRDQNAPSGPPGQNAHRSRSAGTPRLSYVGAPPPCPCQRDLSLWNPRGVSFCEDRLRAAFSDQSQAPRPSATPNTSPRKIGESRILKELGP